MSAENTLLSGCSPKNLTSMRKLPPILPLGMFFREISKNAAQDWGVEITQPALLVFFTSNPDPGIVWTIVIFHDKSSVTL